MNPESLLSRVDRVLVRWSERLNPILVKETRQALKSRQFSYSFGLVLVACWFWSIGGVAMIGPSIAYRAVGSELFMGYYYILAFPLGVIVPFTAFRSLSVESEENTFELLSITTLLPRQIISGKIGSAAIQILVYFSAIAPCLAFTYLLRGIDIISIGVLLLYTFFGSLGLCMIGLLLATGVRERFGHAVLSVAIVIGLFIAFSAAAAIATEFLQWGAGVVNENEFWIATSVLATIYVTYFILFFLAAAACLTFQSENRSTPLRCAMLLQFCCFAAWVSWPWLDVHRRGATDFFLVISCIHWYVMGVFMTGESPQLSSRVMRSLPRSFLGRTFFTWFNPGPSTGFVYAIASLLGAILFVGFAIAMVHATGTTMGGSRSPGLSTFAVAVLGWSYVTIFLGLGKLVVSILRRFGRINLLVSTGIHLMVLGACTATPLTIQFNSVRWRGAGYTFLQITNPFWTLTEMVDSRSPPLETKGLLIIVPVVAAVVLLFNLPTIIAEVRHTRVAVPRRIAEEEALLTQDPKPVKTSPWD